MESTTTLEKTYSSCVVELNPETQKQLGIAEGSIVIMHAKNGAIEVEILPPPSAELEELSMYINEKYKDVLEGLRRIGD